MLQAIPSFYAKNSEKILFISANTFEKKIVYTDYGIAHHDDKMCSLPASKYLVIIFGETEELIHKLDAFCFTYQHMDYLYTLFKYRFSGKILAKSANVFNNVQRAISFNQRNRGVDTMPSIPKRRFMRKSVKQHFLSVLQETKQNRPMVHCLQKQLKSQEDYT